jgi:exodeoxyribonuclease VII large subunit
VVKLVIIPAQVQGADAPRSVADAIARAQTTGADTIIFGRGGGSAEDLAAFNTEIVARAVYNSAIPTISAVGHETDFSIADMAADMRAPTPSAAAEIAVPDFRELVLRIDDYRTRLSSSLIRLVERKRERLEGITDSRIFSDPGSVFEYKRESLKELYHSASEAIEDMISSRRTLLELLSEKADAMSPLSVLKRGYSVCENEKGEIAFARKLKSGDGVKLILSDGTVTATVCEVDKKRGK